ncbi:organic solute transporter subunit alpha/Transmembrane protein [Linnemannia elongata]|nr:organic solute transporter subunit alpha/Transmembrane protein [Linnemannia elongata]
MSTEHEPILSPKGCPIENFPEDPERLFTANGLTLDYPRIGWIAGGCCTFLATAISLVLIYRHYQYYTKPNQQRYIVRMLLMVPIYAITSWFSFVYVREAIYYETIRVFYEAFVIASFLILLLQYLGDSLEDQKRALKRHKKTERWFFPMCCLKYNPSRPHFLQFMKWGILQYVPLNVLGSLLTVVLETQGTYCESSWNPKFGHVWILFINFTSVTLATYFLIMFYFTIRADLKEYEPFYKFLAIKLVIFFSFWQSLVVEGFVYFGNVFNY